jgi:chaperonin GroEL (HSP60 family)
MAAVAISNVVKSSLGPVGLDKMLVDDVGVSITFHANSKWSIYL